MKHPTGRLADYVAGTLPDHEAAAVAAHLSQCETCRQDAVGWHRVAESVRARVMPAPTSVIAAVRGQLAASRAESRAAAPPVYRAVPGTRPVVQAVGILSHQARLVGWQVWVVSAMVLVAGIVLAGWVPDSTEPVLAVVVPLASALAVASACGGEEPPDELIRATPTSVRTILLARLTLVLGAVFLGAATGSLGLSLVGAGDPGRLLAAWLGPVVLLSAVSFAFSVAWRPTVGLSTALALWVLRVLVACGALDAAMAGVVETVWRTSWPPLVVAGVLVTGVLAAAPQLTSARAVQLTS